jgi:hypothetical protein
MKAFNTLTEAQDWCAKNADGDCTIRWTMEYAPEFYMGYKLVLWSMNLQRFVVNF